MCPFIMIKKYLIWPGATLKKRLKSPLKLTEIHNNSFLLKKKKKGYFFIEEVAALLGTGALKLK